MVDGMAAGSGEGESGGGQGEGRFVFETLGGEEGTGAARLGGVDHDAQHGGRRQWGEQT
ncbi:hypothetical protein [Nocardia nova]|uniref:hypothetical protein n=1 Tax=Nocardia nova TaxID=37330 RepID=UPI0015E462DE|nr:hypothetical protein [Nocardia nova]